MKPSHHLDKNVSPNWKPVRGLEGREPGMTWSDRARCWLVSLAGLAITGAGVAVVAYLRIDKLGGALAGLGFVVFALGFPSQAERNGYRSS